MSEQEFKQHEIDWGDPEILEVDEKKIEITVECKSCYKGFMIRYTNEYVWFLDEDIEWKPLQEFIKDDECKKEEE